MALTDEVVLQIQKVIPTLFNALVVELGADNIHALTLGAKSNGEWDATWYIYSSTDISDRIGHLLDLEPYGIAAVEIAHTVVVSGPFRLLSQPARGRCVIEPTAQGGDCIAPLQGSAGTLGGRFYIRTRASYRFLTATHVLNDSGRIAQPLGTSVIHPYFDAQGVIGSVAKVVSWAPSMRTDGGICRVDVDDDDNPSVEAGIGGVIPAGHIAPTGGAVTVSGFKGGVNKSTIKSFGTASVTDILNQPHTFSRVFLTLAMCAQGDSGALALDDNDKVVGMVFAQNDVATIFSDIMDIFDEFTIVPGDVNWD